MAAREGEIIKNYIDMKERVWNRKKVEEIGSWRGSRCERLQNNQSVNWNSIVLALGFCTLPPKYITHHNWFSTEGFSGDLKRTSEGEIEDEEEKKTKEKPSPSLLPRIESWKESALIRQHSDPDSSDCRISSSFQTSTLFLSKKQTVSI